MDAIPEVTIGSDTNGQSVSMPVIGMGTATSPLADAETMKSAILAAIEAGYRHFDSAFAYQTEQPLGEAIAEAINQGMIKSRDEVFVTSKLWCSFAERELVVPAIQMTLQNLGLDYVDLYLIHWPVKISREIPRLPIPRECTFEMDIKAVWEGMEECRSLGLARAIGVSNFSSKKLEQLLSVAKLPPAVNQVEMNPAWQQKELREFCKAKGIHITAYSPLGSGSTNELMNSSVLHDIANSKGKTIAQVSLRWAYEQGVSAVPKSYNKERLKENLEIFGWSLTSEELEKIGQLPQNKAILTTSFMERSDLTDEIDAEI